MIDVLSKPADQVNIRDIEALIELEVPEGEQIEFKETLSTKGSEVDPWMAGKDQIGDRAKNELLQEVVAFSNAHGGCLILGIRESNTKPPVAARISPIPKCADLAERLKLVFRDRVEPQLPQIEVFAVSVDGEKGVVLCRVGKSRGAPHRVTKTLVCPVRRSDRCEPMTMREIQDMTLNVSRGLEWLEKRLSARSEGFQQEFKRLLTPEDAFGVRLTGAPVGNDIRIDRVFREGRLAKEFDEPWCTVLRLQDSSVRELNGRWETPIHWQPRLRATRAEISYDFTSAKRDYNSYRELHCDGLVELGFVCVGRVSGGREGQKHHLPADLPVEAFANLVVWADRVRRQAFVPMAEYALDVEIHVIGGAVDVGTDAPRPYWDGLSIGSTNFPRYPLGNSEEIPSLVNLFWRDFWHAVGRDIGVEENPLSVKDWPRQEFGDMSANG